MGSAQITENGKTKSGPMRLWLDPRFWFDPGGLVSDDELMVAGTGVSLTLTR